MDYFDYKGYHGSAEVCTQSKILHGKIQFIQDLVTYEATSIEDLKAEFESAVDDYLETCKALGKEPDKEFRGSFNVRLGSELHREVAIAAFRNGKTLNEFIKEAVSHELAPQNWHEEVHHHYDVHFNSDEIEVEADRATKFKGTFENGELKLLDNKCQQNANLQNAAISLQG